MIAPSEKIIPDERIVSLCNLYRSQRKKIVFTNGCFDILHVGHLRYLFEAAQQGDVLIVGVNSDASVRRSKSDKRPIIPEQQRMEMLCGFYSVTHTVLFNEDTPEALIQKIKPDCLTKGGDWEIHQIIGADFVRRNGGKVMSLKFIEGSGTSSIIDHIINRYTQT